MLVNSSNTSDMHPNTGMSSHNLVPPPRNGEHAEPIGIRGLYSDSTQSLSISVNILFFSSSTLQRLTYSEIYKLGA